MMVTDVCVPISELSGAIHHAREQLEAVGLVGGILGHVGDGNFHALVMVDMNDAKEVELSNQFNESIVHYALSKNGTCTGEHGVGIGKQKYQEAEHGEAYHAMKLIKKALDPNNILNPGKIVKVD